MSINVGSVEVTVVPDARKFNDLLGAQLNQAGKKAGEQVGQDFIDSVQEKVKKSKPVELPPPDTKKSDAEIDRFLRDFNAKMRKRYQQSGDDGGNALAQGMRLSFLRNSPLIAAAVGAGLIAGAPAAVAGAGVLFAGIAAVSEKNNVQLQASAKATGAAISGAFSQAASVTVPMFTSALGRLSAAVTQLEPQLASAFGSLGAPIDSLTTGVLALVQNAMPGLVAALRNAGPVFAGLSSLLSEIGAGLGQFFQLVSQHGDAAGAVFQALGQAVGAILPILGELIGAGVELGSAVLPPLASVLSVIAKVIQAIGPALPAVVAGFGGLLIARSLQGPLQTLAQNLAFASYNGGTFATAAGKMSTAVSGLASGLPLAGLVLGTFIEVQQRATDQAKQWAQALLQGGTASETASAQMSNLFVAMNTTNSGFEGFVTGLVGFGAQAAVTVNALSQVKEQQKQLTDQMSPLWKAQQAVTKAQNDYLTALADPHHTAAQAASAASALSGANDHLTTIQGQLNAVTGTGSTVTATLKSNLQLTADAASAANTQISLLKGALDALTGKTVSLGDAQVAVTQATSAALTALDGQKDSAGRLTSALVDQTGAINLNTSAGAAAWQALTQLSSADNQLISTMEQQGATTAQVTAKDAELRDSFIQTAEKMGFSAGEAQNLANQIYGIPSSRTTQISADTSVASKAVSTFQQLIDGLHGTTVTVQVSADHTAGVILGSASEMSRAGFKVGYAQGGVIPGYAPGVDSVHAMLSPGEGVLVPEAVRGIGGAAGIQAINAAFSSRVPRFAAGGVVDKTILANVMDNLLPVMQAVGAGLRSFSAPGAPTAVSGNVALGQQLAAVRGWTGSLWNALYALWQRESGWRNTAQNPTSTAYGIPQLLDGTWASTGYSKTSNARIQILAGENYIAGRYGNPGNAWAHETRFGWYDQGGVLPPGPSLVYNGTGAPELVAPRQTFQQALAGPPGGAAAPSGDATVNIYDVNGVLLGSMRGEIARSNRQAALSASAGSSRAMR